jgi:hypothetical protein
MSKTGDFIFNVPDDKYLEMVSFAIASKNILGDKFANAFFDKNNSFIKNFSKEFGQSYANNLISFCSLYNSFSEFNFVRPDKYQKMEEVFSNMIYSYCRKNNLDIDNYKDILLKNPVYKEENGIKINLNENLYIKVKEDLEHIKVIQDELKQKNGQYKEEDNLEKDSKFLINTKNKNKDNDSFSL